MQATVTPTANAVATPANLAHLLAPLDGGGQLVDLRHLPARFARFGELSRPLPADLARDVGRRPLWAHQAEAIDLLRGGQPVVVATGTASGKSRCFWLPIAEACLDEGAAIMVFPTKALAHDQLRALEHSGLPGIEAATYDGDADPEDRSLARRRANVLLTNPEMLHYAICPNHDRWHRLLARVRYVVVDELHAYRGIFGSHLAHVLRRLLRLCHHYGADPVLVGATATVGRPDELARSLLGVDAAIVDDDGSPRGPRAIALWDPRPADDPSPEAEAGRVGAALVGAGSRTLAFCRSRWAAEVTAEWLRERLGPGREVRAYRGGYLPEERREIELELASGRLDAVAATNALELGLDVSGLDSTILCGFPGTVASFWQQVGRAGRGTAPSSSVLVAGRDHLDRWVLRHADELFTRAPEPVVVNPANRYVLLPHLATAAAELALRPEDDRWWPDALDEGVRHLVGSGHLRVRNHRAAWNAAASPAHRISLRSTGLGELTMVDTDDVPIGTVDAVRAPREAHPGARYLHQGRAWRVLELDLDEGRAVLAPDDSGQRVSTRTDTSITVLDTVEQRVLGPAVLTLGTVVVTQRVTGYTRRERDGTLVEEIDLDLPPDELATTAFWLGFEPDLASRLGIDDADLGGALHGMEHALIGMLPLTALCDRWDVGGVSTVHHGDVGGPAVFVHDGAPGGAGVAPLGFGAAEDLVVATAAVVGDCDCQDGCPACVVSPKCGNGNQPLHKAAAARLLGELAAAVAPPASSPGPRR